MQPERVPSAKPAPKRPTQQQSAAQKEAAAEAKRYLAALGTALRELRVEHELSQEALALESGVHRNYVGGIERAERQPTVTAVVRLAHAMGLDPLAVFERAARASR